MDGRSRGSRSMVTVVVRGYRAPGASGHWPNTSEAQVNSAASGPVSPAFGRPQGLPITVSIAGGSLVRPAASTLSWKQFPGLWSDVAAARSPVVGFPKNPLPESWFPATSVPKAWNSHTPGSWIPPLQLATGGGVLVSGKSLITTPHEPWWSTVLSTTVSF